MEFIFDHIVHYVEEPGEAKKILLEKGFHAVDGGKHQNRSTFNVLSYFNLSYIELIGTYNKQSLEETEQPEHSLMATIIGERFTEGLVRAVIRTKNIEKVAQHFREKGLIVNGPFYLSRKRPDGSLLEWQLLFVGDESTNLELPFIIQWNDSDEKRRTDLIERESILPNSADIEFSHITFAVKDLEKTSESWSELFNLKIGEMYIDEELNAQCKTLELPGGNLVFSSPIGNGVVSEVLEKRGEKPFQVNFTSKKIEILFEMFGSRYRIKKC